jgi:hypothetical protein
VGFSGRVILLFFFGFVTIELKQAKGREMPIVQAILETIQSKQTRTQIAGIVGHSQALSTQKL